MSAPFLDLQNVTVFRGSHRILQDFTLQLRLGETTIILGPNGAGKSTLLGLIDGTHPCAWSEDSSCQLFGETHWSLAELRHRLGVVQPEDVRRFRRHDTGLDVILSSFFGSFGLTPRMVPTSGQRQRADAILQRLQLSHLAERPFPALSSGEKRRLLIARALVHDPEVLILDEPTTALDLPSRWQLLDLLNDLSAEGLTLVLVTHDPSELPQVTSRTILLQHGKILADGPPPEVLTASNLTELYRHPVSVSWQDHHPIVTPKK